MRQITKTFLEILGSKFTVAIAVTLRSESHPVRWPAAKASAPRRSRIGTISGLNVVAVLTLLLANAVALLLRMVPAHRRGSACLCEGALQQAFSEANGNGKSDIACLCGRSASGSSA